MSLLLTKEFSIELLKAMGAPVENCQQVIINMPIDSFMSVDITYSLDSAVLQKVCDSFLVRVNGMGS